MRKSTKFIRILSGVLAGVLLMGASACNDSGGAGKNNIEVWGAYSSLKIMQDQYNYEKGPAEIDISMAQGETESGQIIFTPSADVEQFDVTVSDLNGTNGNVFKKENIDVYVQKYIEVVEKTENQTNDFYPAGWYPDMLLPMETAKAFGENTVKAGKNQGITIDFTTPDQFPAGIYTGEVLLTVDGENFKIPVQVEVWDFSVAKAYGKTAFVLYQWKLGERGEFDNSDEMYKAYYDKCLNEYKTCLYLLPNTYDQEKFIPTLLEYWDNPNFTSFCLPQSENDTDSQNNIDAAQIERYLILLAENSTPDKVLLDKAYFYPLQVDEPTDSWRRELLERLLSDIEKAEANALAALEESGYFDQYGGIGSDYYNRIKEALKLDMVITTPDVEFFGDKINSYCPPIQYYNTQYLDTLYAETAEKMGGEKWYYTCMQPRYPYPTHHMDDYLIGARIMRWMQKDYDLEGYLYWNMASYNANPYDDPVRYKGYPGDGYFLYPGKKYNSPEPFGSLRALTLRDGQEDLNMLYEFQNILDDLNQYYKDVSFSVNDVLEREYDALYTKLVYNPDDANFFAVRDLTAQKLLAAKSEAKYVSLFEIAPDGKNEMTVYVADGVSVEINGHKLTGASAGNGQKFVYEIPDAELGKTISVKLGKGDFALSLTELAAEKNTEKDIASLAANISLSEDSTKSVQDGVLHLTMISKGETLVEQLAFKPYINLVDAIPEDYDRIGSIRFVLENVSSEDYTITVKLIDDEGISQTVEKILIKANEKTELVIKNVDTFNTGGAKTLKTVKLEFENLRDGVLYEPRNLNLSAFSYTVKGGNA